MGRKSRKIKEEKIKRKSRFSSRIILVIVISFIAVGFTGILVVSS